MDDTFEEEQELAADYGDAQEALSEAVARGELSLEDVEEIDVELSRSLEDQLIALDAEIQREFDEENWEHEDDDLGTDSDCDLAV